MTKAPIDSSNNITIASIMPKLKELEKKELEKKELEKKSEKIFEGFIFSKAILESVAHDNKLMQNGERLLFFKYLPNNKYKNLFEHITKLSLDKQNIIMECIFKLPKDNRQKYYNNIVDFYSGEYKKFIKDRKIDKDFFQQNGLSYIYINKLYFMYSDFAEETKAKPKIQTLRSAIFRLLNKIKSDDISTYDEYKLEKLMLFFDDMKRDEEIKKSSLYKQKNAQQNKRIKILKDCVLKPRQYTKLLKTIIRHKSYIDDHAMFNLLLYLVQFPPNVIELQPFLARYSFSFYKEHVLTKDITIGINELFGHSGFVFRDKDVKNKNDEISFEKLREFTYSSSIVLEKDIKPYASHPDKHYIYYALTKNPNLSEYKKRYIANDIQNLDFLYPYTKEAQTILESIERATGKNDAKDEASHKKSTDTLEEVHEFYLYDGFEFALLEESAKYIAVVASKTLSEYISALQTFLSYVVSTLENLRKFGIDVESNNSFICYVLYLFECVRLDKKILYYETHYLDNIVHKLQSNMFFDAQNAELKLLNDYLQIKSYLLNVAFYALNYTSNNIPATKQIFELYNHTFNFLDKTITQDVYFQLRDICYPSQNYIFLEYRFVKLGAKLKAIFEKRKSLLKNDCFDITSWETFCEFLKEKDEKYLKDLKQKRYRCKTMEIAQAHEGQMEKGNSIIEYYRNFESDDKLDDDHIEDWKFFIDKWNIAEDKK